MLPSIRLLVLSSALAVAGCAGSAPSTSVRPELLAAEEQRLLAPLMQQRALVCDSVRFDISANFHHQVARPAISPEIHKFSREQQDDGDIYRWSSSGGIQSPLKFWIGQTQFVALRSAVLCVRRSGALALEVTAKGRVTESQQGMALRDWQEIRIENGAFRRR